MKETKIDKSFSFLIVAGGSGSRIGGREKQFRLLGKEKRKPLWCWSFDLAVSLCDFGVDEVVLVFPQGSELSEKLAFPEGKSFPPHVGIAFGGATRADSVRNGLTICTRDFVMVHDAARPFASAELLRRLMESTTPTVGAIPVMPVTEALKRVNSEGGIQVADREEFYVTQTPQSFFREALVQALEKPCTVRAFKDEAEAWLAAGLELRCIEGERLNFKVTWPEDLKLAEALIINREKITDEKERGGDGVRVGIGYDVHRLVPERPLVLGGVEIPSPLGLLGHSDADVLAHAVADAILGAADLPDIGNLFPASDNRYKNADSMKLLREAVELVNGELWKIVWVDAVLEAQIPRLNFFLPAMKEKLSAVLNPQGPHCVNIKAKSAEGTNDEGAGRSIVCRAVATLRYACEGVAK